MLNILNKYRSFLHSLLLASYLLSVFQVPIFELFHLLSHTYHHISYSKTEFHSYNSHYNLNHDHSFLQLLNDPNSNNEDHTSNIHDLELKKKVEINATSLNNTISSFKKNSNNFGNPTEPIKFYRTLVVPPPELF